MESDPGGGARLAADPCEETEAIAAKKTQGKQGDAIRTRRVRPRRGRMTGTL